jgi:hypothetical protein
MRWGLLFVLVLLLGAAVLPTMAQACDEGMTHVRLAHFAQVGSEINLYLNGVSTRVQGLAFGEFSQWVDKRARDYDVRVVPTGGVAADALVTLEDVPLCGEQYVTLVLYGLSATNSVAIQPIVEDLSALQGGRARITVFHAIANAPAVDVVVEGSVLISALTYPGQASVLGLSDDPAANDGVAVREVLSGTFNVAVTAAGDAETVVLSFDALRISSGYNYFVAAIGTPTSPNVAISATPLLTE